MRFWDVNSFLPAEFVHNRQSVKARFAFKTQHTLCTVMVQFTFNDIDTGARLVEALTHQAKSLPGISITYVDLLTLMCSLHAKDDVLGRAVPVGIGVKLQFVESFSATYAYFNPGCVAASRETMRRRRVSRASS